MAFFERNELILAQYEVEPLHQLAFRVQAVKGLQQHHSQQPLRRIAQRTQLGKIVAQRQHAAFTASRVIRNG